MKKREKNSEDSNLSKSKRSRNGSKSKKFTRVSLRAGGISEYFENGAKRPQNQFKQKISLCTGRQFMRWSVLLIAVYNVIFIPLQFAYRIKFDNGILMMEIFTLILYALDIYFRVQNIRQLEQVGGNLQDSEINSELTAMVRDKDQFAKKVQLIKIEIACSTIAWFPFSLVF
jgi:hypothetical protein